MTCRSLTILAGCVLSVVTLPVLADSIDDVIEARQGFYKVLSHNAGALFGMAKGNIEYDAKTAKAHAENIRMLTQLNNASLWPQGSSKDDRKGKTRALPIIWSTYPAITEKSEVLDKAASDLADSAGEGLDGLRANIGALGAACKGCHETYRAKDF